SRIAEKSQDPELLEEAAESEARMGLDLSVAARLLLKAANCRTDRGDVVGAVRSLSRALEINPEHEAAAGRVRELLLARGDVDRLNQVIAESPPDDVKIEAHVRLASVLDEHLGDGERALANLNAALAAEPNNRAALERLLGLQKRHKRFDAAAETAQKLVRV